MTAQLSELRAEVIRLRDLVLDRLPEGDQRQISELIDANEFGVALEWVLDSLTETGRKLPHRALKLVESLAKQMEMYPAVLTRIPPELIEPPEPGILEAEPEGKIRGPARE